MRIAESRAREQHVVAEVDGNPHRNAFPQRVGSEGPEMSRLRVTLRVTA
jgi:hypothetical protein